MVKLAPRFRASPGRPPQARPVVNRYNPQLRLESVQGTLPRRGRVPWNQSNVKLFLLRNVRIDKALAL